MVSYPSPLLKYIDINHQAVVSPNDSNYPPNAIGNEEILIFTAKRYNFRESVNYNSFVVFEGNSDLLILVLGILIKGVGLPLQKANRL